MRLAVLIAVLAVLIVPANAGATIAGTDALVAGTAGAMGVSAYGGDLAWSRVDADGKYHLVTDVAGTIAEPPVPPESQPFDVSLGNEGNGAVVAVYSRCEPGCNIEALRLDASTGERDALKVNTSRCDEVAPSVADGVLAFVRRGARCSLRDTGLYARLGSKVVLLTRKVSRAASVPARTACTPTRVLYDYRPTASGGDSYVRQVKLTSRQQNTYAHGAVTDAGGDRVSAPVADGTATYWLDSDPIDETARVVQRHGGTLGLPVQPTSATVSSGVVYYTATDGIHRFTPSA